MTCIFYLTLHKIFNPCTLGLMVFSSLYSFRPFVNTLDQNHLGPIPWTKTLVFQHVCTFPPLSWSRLQSSLLQLWVFPWLKHVIVMGDAMSSLVLVGSCLMILPPLLNSLLSYLSSSLRLLFSSSAMSYWSQTRGRWWNGLGIKI